MDKDKLFKRYRNMKQYKNFSDEELMKIVQKKIEEKELLECFIGLKDDEKKKALQLYNRYIMENSFESLAEKSTLTNLVYIQILIDRVKTFIKDEGDTKKGAIPIRMAEKLVELTNQEMSLKEKLGMLKDAKSESALDLVNELKEKALKYYEEHAGETYVKCPECENFFRLLMKIDDLEPAKATFFKGTTLYNVKLMELYHYKKLTKNEIAEILGVHENYIDFIYNNIYLKRNDK